MSRAGLKETYRGRPNTIMTNYTPPTTLHPVPLGTTDMLNLENELQQLNVAPYIEALYIHSETIRMLNQVQQSITR